MDRNPGRVRERGDSPAGDRLSHQTDADYADRALLTELMLTPKPGLVDRRNCGTHRDMDVQTFLASARHCPMVAALRGNRLCLCAYSRVRLPPAGASRWRAVRTGD